MSGAVSAAAWVLIEAFATYGAFTRGGGNRADGFAHLAALIAVELAAVRFLQWRKYPELQWRGNGWMACALALCVAASVVSACLGTHDEWASWRGWCAAASAYFHFRLDAPDRRALRHLRC